MTVWVGTSGWQYDDWRGRFYDDGRPQREWLRDYADAFATVEVNNTFYRLPSTDAVAAWAAETPDDFCFAVKASRYLTHVLRLKDPAEPVERLLGVLEPLGAKLGPVLLQLPPTMKADPDRLDDVLGRFPSKVRVVVEPRHDSWWTDEVRRVLERRGAALAWADRRNRLLAPLWRTAPFGYVRLHEGAATPAPCYGRTALNHWAARAADAFGPDDVWVFFNNDHAGCAPRDAARFGGRCERLGLEVTRRPSRGRVRAG